MGVKWIVQSSDECVGGQSLKLRVSGGGGQRGGSRGRGGRELSS